MAAVSGPAGERRGRIDMEGPTVTSGWGRKPAAWLAILAAAAGTGCQPPADRGARVTVATSWGGAASEALHRELLRETVRHAYEHAPATRRKMDAAGVRPQDIREVADLRNIPLTKKAELKHIQKGEPPFGGLAALPPRAMRRIYVSPGPTFDPEGRDGTHWRWEKPIVIKPAIFVQNITLGHKGCPGHYFYSAKKNLFILDIDLPVVGDG